VSTAQPVTKNSTTTTLPVNRDPIAVARIVNVAWHVRQVLADWRDESTVVYDEEWFRQHRRTAAIR